MGWDSFVSGLQSAAAGIYSTVDYVALGALPDFDESYPLPAGGFTGETSLAGQLLGGAGDVAVNTVEYLPQIAAPIGQVPPALLTPTFQALPTWGAGLGGGIGAVFQGGLGGLGEGLGSGLKDLLIPFLVVGGVVLVGVVVLSKNPVKVPR